uniref:RNA-guided endonuclease InsQ/TnpB family protein n=1 Tax=Candidatus Cyanaurora vandensis TaxID=2714958 RepID=UPI00257B50A7
MLVLELKLVAAPEQFALIDEAIRTFQFIRNKALRYWIDTKGATKYDLNKQCAILAKEFAWANKLNSMARQSAAERAWSAVSRFFDNCKKNIVGKKGYPKFQKDNRSVEYKTTGWKLSDERRFLTITDGFDMGKLKLLGTRDLRTYSKEQIKRVRLVRRADGYYAQFCVDVERNEDLTPTGKTIGLDMGLESFYTDSNGVKVENPRYLRKAEKQLKRAQRRLSRKAKGSKNRIKARKRLGRQHLKVSRQRKDFAIKTARCVVQSNDLVAIEDLKVRNMVKNHHLAKSISDASWSMFRAWLEYYGKVMGRIVIAMAPHYTSQECSSCHVIVKKSLSTRTHTCQCGCVLDRDHNAALNILAAG